MRVRRLFRWTGILLASLILLAATAFIVIQTTWFKNRLRQIAITQAGRVLNGELRIGRLSGSLFTGVTLDDVSLVQDGVPVVTAARVRAHYDPMALIRRDFIFDNILIERALVQVVEDQQGWNVARLAKPRAARTGEPMVFAIRDLRLTDSEVIVTPLRGDRRQLRRVALESSLSLEPDGLAMPIQRLTLVDEQSGYTVRELSGTLTQGFSHADVRFVAEAGPSRIAGAVAGRLRGEPRELNGRVELTRVNAAVFTGDPRWTTDLTGLATLRTATVPGSGDRFVDYTFEGPHAAAYGYEAQQIRASGRWTRERITFDADARAYGARLDVTGAWTLASPGRPARLTAAGRFGGADLRRVPGTLNAPPLATRLNGAFTLAAAGGSVTADVSLDESVVEGATIGAGTIGHFEGGRGRYRYSGIGHLAGLDLQRLARPLDLPVLAEARYASRLTGSFYIGGRGGASIPRFIVGGATLIDSDVSGTALPIMSASMTLTGERLAIDANGIFTHLAADTLGLQQRMASDLNGVVNGLIVIPDLRVPVSLDTIDVQGQVVLNPSTVQGVEITRALVDGQLAAGLLTVNDMTVDAPAGQLKGSGTVALGEEGESSFVLAADVQDLGVLGAHIGRPLAGTAHLDATVTGPPSALAATGTLTASQLQYGEGVGALTLNSSFTARVADRRFDQVAVNAETAATFVTLGDVEILRLAATSSYQSRLLDLKLNVEDQARTINLEGAIALQPEAQEVQLRTLNVTAGATTWQLPPGTPATVKYGGEAIAVEGLSLIGASGRIDASGALALGDAPAGEAPLQLTLTDVLVADVNRLLLGTRRLDGVINGTVTVAGSARAPDVRADVAVTQGAVEGVAYESFTGTVNYRDGRATLDVTLTQSAANQLTATGMIPIAMGDDPAANSMDVRVRSTGIGLALAQVFTAEVSAVAGAADLDVTVTGTRRSPMLNGTVAVNNGAFTVTATGVTYSDLQARLRLENSRLQIDDMRVSDADGHVLTAGGGVDVFAGATGRAVDVFIRADGVHVLDNALGDVAVDMDLRARGTLTALRIEGDIRVADGSLEVGRILEMTTSEAYRALPADRPAAPAADVGRTAGGTASGDSAAANGQEPPRAAPGGGLFGETELALRVRLPDNVVLRGRDMRVGTSAVGVGDMNIIAGGMFEVTKPAGGDVRLLGAVEIVRGFYTFQGRRFDVERGSTVRFRGERPLNPALGVTASREISGVTAEVGIGGTARDPRLELTSRPPLDESDILSLIVFNRPVNDLGGNERLSLGERAGALAAGALAAPIADSVARALNLDVVEIQPTAVAGQAPSLALGSQIGSRIYVGLKQEFGQGDVSTVSLEYRVTRLLRLVTSLAYSAVQTQAARRASGSGIDLIFVVRY